ncbi:MAG: pentapeptide repeat-containing protein [Hyphomicrobiaceae bacterium]
MSARLSAVLLLAGLIAPLTGVAADAAGEVGAEAIWRFGSKLGIVAKDARSVTAGGARVDLSGSVLGNAWLIGADLTSSAAVGADLTMRGANVGVTGRVGGAAELSGARVTLAAPVGGRLEAKGVEVRIEAPAEIAGDAEVSGGDVTFSGKAGGRLTLRGRDVLIDGAVTGPAEIVATKVRIGPNARIASGITVYSIGEPEVAPGAEIAGPLTARSLYEAREMRPYLQGAFLAHVKLALVLGASGLAAGIAFLLFGRGTVEDTIDRALESPARSALVGLGTLVLLPVGAGILALTVVGAPLAVALLLLLPFLVLIGLSGAGFGLGEWLFNRAGEPQSGGARGLMLLAGLVVLMLVVLVPVAGPIVVGLATLVGLGGFLVALNRRLRAEDAMAG